MTKPKIAFQGEPGANSDEACREHYPDYEPAPYAVFEDAFEAVRSGACALGMIPVENSIIGRQGDVHHLLPNSGLRIIAERFKPIHFQLMAGEGVLWHHVGLYAYRREALESFVALPPSPLEQREKLEQLRALEAGMSIAVARVDATPLSVDTPADLERARKLLS